MVSKAVFPSQSRQHTEKNKLTINATKAGNRVQIARHGVAKLSLADGIKGPAR
jgi:hypothetical protein